MMSRCLDLKLGHLSQDNVSIPAVSNIISLCNFGQVSRGKTTNQPKQQQNQHDPMLPKKTPNKPQNLNKTMH